MFKYHSAEYFREMAEEKRMIAETRPKGSFAYEFWMRQAEASEIDAKHAEGLESAMLLLERLNGVAIKE